MIRLKPTIGAFMLTLVTPALIAPSLAVAAPDSAPSYRQETSASNAVRNHPTETRQGIISHLERARQVQGEVNRTASR